LGLAQLSAALPLGLPLGLGLGMQLEVTEGVPRINPWGSDRGRLMEALSVCGAVFLEVSAGEPAVGSALPDPHYSCWHELWREALTTRAWFQQREAVRQRLLSFNRSEDLARTMQGGVKAHTPDLRYNFGVTSWNAASRSDAEWQELGWIAQNFREALHSTTELVRRELQPLLQAEVFALPQQEGAALQHAASRDSLAEKLRLGTGEHWSGSRLRHSVYPVNGSCTEHTDYGVLTFQQSTASGLEAHLFGEWRPLCAPPGCAVAFAGDMLELLTNGRVPALRHRVSLQRGPDSAASVGGAAAGVWCGQDAVRQSHILFLQPDKSSVVAPLAVYRRNDGSDRRPVRYGDWHTLKSSLAFSH